MAALTMAPERSETTTLRQWRCPHCGWRLFDARLDLHDGEIISVVCRGCRRLVTFAGAREVDDIANSA